MLPSNFKPCRHLQGFYFVIILMVMGKYMENDTKRKAYLSEMMTGDSDAAKEPITFSVDEGQLPEIKSWEVGKTYSIVLTGKMTGLNKSYTDENELRASFEATKAEVEEEDVNDTENDSDEDD